MKILVVDDQRSARHLIRRMLAGLPGIEVVEADGLESAWAALERAPFDLLLIDLRLEPAGGDRGGLELLRRVRERGDETPAVMITAASELGDVRQAMRLGAQDYVLKDELCPEMLVPIVAGIRERQALRGEVQQLRQQVDRSWGLGAIIGSSPQMQRVRRLVRQVADAEVPVLICGETGTGKELVARAIHTTSQRRGQPFVGVNCCALPGTLIESLIFGHERGAFTGADRRVRGQLELAAGGTLLLDEIAEMPLELQSKLLRVLEERRFRPLGSEHEIELRARVLAASHVDLPARIESGRFRRDLYYRLNVIRIDLPPLEQRIGDLPELLQHFVASVPRRLRFSPASMRWLAERPWPGNVRELRNLVDRLVLLADQDLIEVATLVELSETGRSSGGSGELVELARRVLAAPGGSESKLDRMERILLQQALEAAAGNKSEAARLVGLDRKTFERHYARLAGGPRAASGGLSAPQAKRPEDNSIPGEVATRQGSAGYRQPVGAGSAAQDIAYPARSQVPVMGGRRE